jgi:hypothetical protein
VHDAAFAVVENEPLAHEVHVRSAVVVPFASTAWPAAHEVHGAHEVADEPSWSHVPLAHATFGADPPAQWVPGSHAAQIAGLVDVAAWVSTVPAAHDPCAVHTLWLIALE